ncbi:MAG: biopolymer transporter ExbD [Planctomycetia bacterium]|nr:biopolymer transporter ExbD [Planctomycetia bacterium]
MRTFRPESTQAGFNMTPMIDVVFLLIIFFLVASHFSNQENAVEVDLPKTTEGKEMEMDESPRLTVSMPTEGEMYIGMKSVTESEIKEILRKEKARWKDDFELRIRTYRKLPYAEVEPIMLMAAEAGVYDVQFAVLQE